MNGKLLSFADVKKKNEEKAQDQLKKPLNEEK